MNSHFKFMHDPAHAFICDQCGKETRTYYHMKLHHARSHSGPKPPPKPVQCELCGSWLKCISNLKRHIKHVHSESTEEHRCHICNKTSVNARALKKHLNFNHFAVRKHKCTLCEKAFKSKLGLKEHVATHTGEANYNCPYCAMPFKCNANYVKHQQRLHRAEFEADRREKALKLQLMYATAANAENVEQKDEQNQNET